MSAAAPAAAPWHACLALGAKDLRGICPSVLSLRDIHVPCELRQFSSSWPLLPPDGCDDSKQQQHTTNFAKVPLSACRSQHMTHQRHPLPGYAASHVSDLDLLGVIFALCFAAAQVTCCLKHHLGILIVCICLLNLREHDTIPDHCQYQCCKGTADPH